MFMQKDTFSDGFCIVSQTGEQLKEKRRSNEDIPPIVKNPTTPAVGKPPLAPRQVIKRRSEGGSKENLIEAQQNKPKPQTDLVLRMNQNRVHLSVNFLNSNTYSDSEALALVTTEDRSIIMQNRPLEFRVHKNAFQ